MDEKCYKKCCPYGTETNICKLPGGPCGCAGYTPKPLTTQKDARAKLACSDGLEAIAFLLTLVPEWALNMEQGLDPTYYGTGSYEGDKKVYDRVMEIKGLLEKESL